MEYKYYVVEIHENEYENIKDSPHLVLKSWKEDNTGHPLPSSVTGPTVENWYLVFIGEPTLDKLSTALVLKEITLTCPFFSNLIEVS